MATTHTIKGTIYDQHNRPMPKHVVEVFDQDLRQTQLLGKVETDNKGEYRLGFDSKKALRSDVKSVDVFITVKKPRGRTVLGQSKVHFNIPEEYMLDYKIDGSTYLGLPEFDVLVTIVEPLLVGQRVKIHQLKEDDKHQDISFLASETSEPRERLELLPLAFQFGTKAKLDPDIFYGLFRLSFPQTWEALLLVKRESIMEGLEAAINANIISSKFTDQIKKILTHFDALSSNLVLQEGNDFKTILSNVLPQSKDQKAVINTWLKHEEASEKFWKELKTIQGFKNGEKIKDIQRSLHLNLLTLKQPALTKLLVNESKKDSELKDVRGFAKFEFKDWKKRIDKLVTNGQIEIFPDGITGETQDEKTTHYAETLTRFYKELYPTSVFASKLQKDRKTVFEPKIKTDLKTFLADNPDFNLETTSIKQDFEGSNTNSVRDKDKLLSELMSVNRLYKLSPNYEHVAQVRRAKLTSSSDIVRHHTERSFAKKFKDAIGTVNAKTIFKKAVQIDKKATAIALNYKMSSDVPVFAMSTLQNGEQVNLQSTFSDNQLCQCNHCQSLYSPAAYFVDLLNFINRKSEGAYSELLGDDADDTKNGRRPDLQHILLTCQNTHTPLPYIDLVNELFEKHIAPSGVESHQTTLESNQLAAYPEHTNNAAYDLLKDPASTPLSAFLNLPFEETHAYLNTLGVNRHHLMTLFYGNKGDVNEDVFIAAEILGFTPEDIEVLYGNIKGSDDSITLVKDMLKETGLNYRDMLQLLGCRFVNPADNHGNLAINILGPKDENGDEVNVETCDIDALEFSTPIALNEKIFRFIQLWKTLAWSMYDLDRVMRALEFSEFPNNTDVNRAEKINTNLILPLSHVVRLNAELGLAIPELLSLWHIIDDINYIDHHKDSQPEIPSLFKRLFQNKENAIEITDNEFVNKPPINEEYRSKIKALLNLSQDESQLVTGLVSKENVSNIYREVLFSRVLSKTVVKVQKLKELSDINIFDQPVDYLKLMEIYKLIDAFNLNIDVLHTVLTELETGDMSDFYKNVIDPNNELNLFERLGEELKKLKKENANNDVISDAIILQISEDLNIDLGYLKNNLDQVDLVFHNSLNEFIDNYKNEFESVDPKDLLAENNSVHKAYLALATRWCRIQWIIENLDITFEEYQYFESKTEFGLAALWKMPEVNPQLFPVFKKLLELVKFRNTLKNKSEDWYLIFNNKIDNLDITKGKFNDLLAKQAKIELSELEYLLGTTNKGFLGYTFDEYQFTGEVLCNILHCAYESRKYETSVKILYGLTIDTLTPIESLIAKNLLKSKYDETAWINVVKPISNVLRERKREALIAYVLHAQSQVQFRNENNITDINDLYAHFLIDIEMSSCMMSSRIKQAISSVQLFIDRCLLGIEDSVDVDNDFASQWNTWRKQYRVWEVNRKIFLYPENWIEPELRDDKSPFFKELESKIMQNDMTHELAEDALQEYLEKLDQVSNLEIMDIFPEKRTIEGQINTEEYIHVIGRTKNSPHIYFYRKQLPTKNWTAWERIDLDIEGNHVLLVVFNGRLILFWGVFEEKERKQPISMRVSGLKNDTGNISTNNNAPSKYLELKLVWSEYKNDKWSRKQISDVIEFISLFRSKEEEAEGIKLHENIVLYSKVNDGIGIYALKKISSNPNEFETGKIYSFDLCKNHLVKLSSIFTRESKMKVFGLDSGRYVSHKIFSKNSFSTHNSGYFDFTTGTKIGNTIYYTKHEEHNIIKINEQKLSQGLLATANATTNANPTPINNKFRLTQAKFIVSYNKNSLDYKYNNFVALEFNNQTFLVKARRSGPRRYIKPVHLNGLLMKSMERKSVFFMKRSDSIGDFNGPGFNFPLPNPDPDPPSDNNPEDEIRWIKDLDYKYHFMLFEHPFTCDYLSSLASGGINAMYSKPFPRRRILNTDLVLNLNLGTFISPEVVKPFPKEKLDFDFKGSYSQYNWELFFHIPLLIATRLNENQKFEEARQWFHYIFDPTSGTSGNAASTYWKTLPFKTEIINGVKSIDEILQNETELEEQVNYWEQNPFNPHAVARLRIAAYMRTTFMKYIDNLIDWADQLFRRDSMESINEAIQLYVLAANLLGKKPENIPQRVKAKEQSFKTIVDSDEGFDRFSNTIAEIENYITPNDSNESDAPQYIPYFCTPKNNVLLKYWERVADRLFKIRNCMNIEGQVRQLALYEPPIDPAQLVRARAAGLDLNTILNEINTSLPHYRFQIIFQKASELCNDVKQLGASLLSALEKKDAEELTLLRSSHEMQMLELIKDIRKKQHDEIKVSLESLLASKTTIEERKSYYESREFMNAGETEYFDNTKKATFYQELVASGYTLASISYLLPEIKIGSGFTIGATYGGANIGKKLKAAADSLSSYSNYLSLQASMSNVQSIYNRRMDDWKFQAKTADLELKQLDKQIIAAEIRLSIAEKEVDNHVQQIENTKQVDEYMRSKFTNTELYGYMVSQISGIYFQSYQLAYDIAKKAEKCYEFELDISPSNIIQFGYWDSLKKGLLSGEKLQYDLRRLDMAYLDNNNRKYEMTKHISLKRLNPKALLNLKTERKIDELTIPEWLFDMDCPGHYKRQIKTVGLSIPCVTGPYTSVTCKLELIDSQIRIKASLPIDDVNNFDTKISNIKSIVTSTSQNDNGMFEGNLRDERYLPFEGAGLVNSKWKLELPDLKQFDYNTITDVILHISYTAIAGDINFKNEVISNYNDKLSNEDNLYRLFSLQHDFPNEWHKFNTDQANDDFVAELKDEHFPYFAQSNWKIENKESMQIGSGGELIDVNEIVNNNAKEIVITNNINDKKLPAFVIVEYVIDN